VTGEKWVPLPGYEGVISVSSAGRVRSENRTLSDKRRWKGRILTATVGRSGYLEVSLPSDKNYRDRARVHRLVCLAFNGPPPPGKNMALHSDGNKFNNSSENMYWGDYDDNMKDRIDHGRHFNVKTDCKYGHALTEDNVYRVASKPNARYCRKCRKRRHDKWYDAVKEARNG